MKPIIGITVNYDFRETIGDVTGLGTPLQDWDYIALDYANAVEKAGGIPVLIPNCKDTETMRPFIGKIDGLLLSGGSDVDPEIYGEPVKRGKCGPVFPRRDFQEAELLKEAFARRIPILGICRGIQFMNAVFGGTLYQDLPSEMGTVHSVNVYNRNHPVHTVTLKEGMLRDILGEESFGTNTYHHQAVKDVCPNGTVVGTAEDGIVEAMEFSGGHPFTLAVQWHPEMMYDSPLTAKLFAAFIKAAAGK
ncbi:MAG: gamma-glutamyl-gamma-aminobutyrate hydrolase family protein [Solobacterium sp.]|nr:gamma-glutamyl-gamma-aminobutyrate hydrolase family protein [Solobacterium sp.]